MKILHTRKLKSGKHQVLVEIHADEKLIYYSNHPTKGGNKMKEEWLLDGAAVPVTCETVTELVNEIKRLIDVIGSMALSQPEQEPVAWVQKDVLTLTHIIKAVVRREKDETYTEPLYTTPQPAQQEPTGMLLIDRLDKWLDASLKERKVQLDHIPDARKMVAQRTWVGLNKEEANKLQLKYQGKPISLSAAVENLLREKNT